MSETDAAALYGEKLRSGDLGARRIADCKFVLANVSPEAFWGGGPLVGAQLGGSNERHDLGSFLRSSREVLILHDCGYKKRAGHTHWPWP